MLKILKFSDAHPPKTTDPAMSPIYFCICFESREQNAAFLQEADLFRLGDKYLTGQEFADAFGIDLSTGTRKAARSRQGLSFASPAVGLNFGSTSLDFHKPDKKPAISEKLRDIRKSEKQLAAYMKWCAEPEYWLCLCFRTEEEKANMLKALGLELEFGGKYLWCHDVARSLGVELIPCPFRSKGTYAGREKELEAMVLDLPTETHS